MSRLIRAEATGKQTCKETSPQPNVRAVTVGEMSAVDEA